MGFACFGFASFSGFVENDRQAARGNRRPDAALKEAAKVAKEFDIYNDPDEGKVIIGVYDAIRRLK